MLVWLQFELEFFEEFILQEHGETFSTSDQSVVLEFALADEQQCFREHRRRPIRHAERWQVESLEQRVIPWRDR